MRHPLHNSDDSAAHVSRSPAESDPAVREALDNETEALTPNPRTRKMLCVTSTLHPPPARLS